MNKVIIIAVLIIFSSGFVNAASKSNRLPKTISPTTLMLKGYDLKFVSLSKNKKFDQIYTFQKADSIISCEVLLSSSSNYISYDVYECFLVAGPKPNY